MQQGGNGLSESSIAEKALLGVGVKKNASGKPDASIRSFSLDEACQKGNQWRYLKQGSKCWRIGMELATIPAMNGAESPYSEDYFFYEYTPGRQYMTLPDESLYAPKKQYGTYEDMIYDPDVSPGDELICTFIAVDDVESAIASAQKSVLENVQELKGTSYFDDYDDYHWEGVQTVPKTLFYKIETGYFTSNTAGSEPSLVMYEQDALREAGIEIITIGRSETYYLSDKKKVDIRVGNDIASVEFIDKYIKVPRKFDYYTKQEYKESRYVSTTIPDLEPGLYVVKSDFDFGGESAPFIINVV